MSNDSYTQIDSILRHLPLEFSLRWCEPGPLGCACLGCANGPEWGAGRLSAKGFTKSDWEDWKRRRLGIDSNSNAAPQAVNSVTGGAANPRPADAAPAFTQGPAPEHMEASKLRSDVDSEDAARYRWLRDQCPYDQRIVIAEMADEGYLLDHHIDKGRCGL